MSAPIEIDAPDQLSIFLNTNEVIPAGALSRFVFAIEDAATRLPLSDSRLILELLEVRSGTKSLLFKIYDGATDPRVGVLAALASLALGLYNLMQEPTDPLAETFAELCVDHGTVNCTITTAEKSYRIERQQVAAIRRLESIRATGVDSNWHSYFFNNPLKTIGQDRSFTTSGPPGSFVERVSERTTTSEIVPDPARLSGKRIQIVRTDRKYPATKGGRPVQLVGGEVPFGANLIDENSIRYLSRDATLEAMESLGKRAPLTGRMKVSLKGAFERDPDGELYFQTAETVFRAELRGMSQVPENQIVAIIAIIDSSEPSMIEVHSMVP